MWTLGIDTSTRAGGVALLGPDGPPETLELGPGPGHSRTLLLRIQEVLAARDQTFAALHRIGVAAGPGAFTGLRAGLAIANGLGFALGRPVVAVSTLEAFATLACGRAASAVVLLDAFRGEVYAARFDVASAPALRRTEDRTFQPAEAIRSLVQAGDLLLGDGVVKFAEVVGAVAPGNPTLAVGSAAGTVARIAAAASRADERRAAAVYVRSLDVEPAAVR